MKFQTKIRIIEAERFNNHQAPFGVCGCSQMANEYHCHTKHGPVRISFGDWCIKGDDGEYYPCTNEEFNKRYDEVKEL